MAVVDDETKRRFKRGFRRRRKNALVLSQQADHQIEKLLIRRFDRLVSVKRFIFLWVLLFGLTLFSGVIQFRALSSYYQTLQPVAGGIYHEGIIGTFTNANPLFATGSANTAVSRLVFSGLFKYDNSNNLVGDLAKDWVLSPNQKVYTVHLNPDITWHDNKPFTADDVVFTYQTIQNIESQSSLYSSWKDIKVSKQDALTVNFELPNPLSAFPYSITNGIVPAHLLKKTPAVGLRSASFNTNPIGTGPFVWKFVDIVGKNVAEREYRISLAAHDDYHGGRSKLDGFNLVAFSDESKLVAAFKEKRINAMSGLETLPEELSADTSLHPYTIPISGAVMAFFNNSRPTLNDVNIRRALVASVDRKKIASLSDHPVQLVDGPLLKGQLGYDPSVTQTPFNKDLAGELLNKAGWTMDGEGKRVKEGKQLAFNLRSQETQEYTRAAQSLQKQWAELGIKITVHYSSGDDLQTAFIANHDYDILLYGISIGVDPDVFAYWDSSQASVSSQGGLNLSEYKSAPADQAIESARTRADQATRVTKYKAFLTAWVQDAPALALYQPNYLYVSRGEVFNYERKATNSGVDRYYNVHEWMIRQQKQAIN